MTLTLPDILSLVGVPAIVAFIFQLVYNRLSTKLKKDRSDEILIKKALQALLRDRIRQNFIQYRELGCIDMADKENFDNMYKIYHTLGKNGVVDSMYEQIMDLPMTCDRFGKQNKNSKGEN